MSFCSSVTVITSSYIAIPHGARRPMNTQVWRPEHNWGSGKMPVKWKFRKIKLSYIYNVVSKNDKITKVYSDFKVRLSTCVFVWVTVHIFACVCMYAHICLWYLTVFSITTFISHCWRIMLITCGGKQCPNEGANGFHHKQFWFALPCCR